MARMPGLRGRVGWRLRSNPLSAVVMAVLVAAGVAALWVAAGEPGYRRDLLLNVGVTLLGVVVTVLILQPLLERARTPEELIHPEFPYARFLEGVACAEHEVRILSASPYVMDEPYRAAFLAALSTAVKKRVRVRILMLDPSSKAAEQRTADLDHAFDVPRTISAVLRAFATFCEGVEPGLGPAPQVRIYSTLPPARMYRWDTRALTSFFPLGSWNGTDIKHYETRVTSGLGQFVDEQFDLLWHDGQHTRSMAEYLRMEVEVTAPGFAPVRRSARYAVCEGRLYVADPALVEALFPRVARDPALRLLHGICPVSIDVDALYRPTPLEADHPAMAPVVAAFEHKYGGQTPVDASGGVVLRLDRVEQPLVLDAGERRRLKPIGVRRRVDGATPS